MIELQEIELQEGETVFSRASEELDARGWCQNYMADEGGRLCLGGAIYVASGHIAVGLQPVGNPGTAIEVLSEEEADRAAEACTRIRNHLGDSLFAWNDTPGRTKAEVLALLQELHEKELANA